MKNLDADRYRKCMRILDLQPQAGEDAIRDAYRQKAKKWHPDKYSTPAEKGVATKRIKRLNNARDYVLRHREAFIRQQPTASEHEYEREASPGYEFDEQGDIRWLDVFPKDNDVADLLMTPVLVVWTLAFGAAITPLFYMYDYGSDDWSEMGPIARLWMRVGPYLVLLVLPFLARNTAGEIWFWSAFVIVLGAEAVAHLMGWWIQRSIRSEVELARRYIESASDTRQGGSDPVPHGAGGA